jgi:hypothetical protein
MRFGRALWILLALNAIYGFLLTLWVTLQLMQNPTERIREGLAGYGLPLTVYASFFFITLALVFLVYFIVSLLIFIRRPNDGFALFTATFLLNFGAVTPNIAEFVQFKLTAPLWYAVPSRISMLFSWPLLMALLVLYPDGQFVPRWSRVLAVIGAVSTLAWIADPAAFSEPTSALGLFSAVSAVVLTGASLYAQAWRYRHYASPLQRQQTKWFVFALAVFMAATFLFFSTSIQFDRGLTPAESIVADLAETTTGALANVVIPLAVGIAILRYRLWDIDILIRKTLTYGLVTAGLAGIFFASVVVLQRVFAALTGESQNELVTVLSTLGIAALFIPLRNVIQRGIDRRFYRRKYDAQQVLAQFAETVRDETDIEDLTGRLVEVVGETMQPRSVSLWLKDS